MQDEKPSKLRHVKEICCQLDVWSIIITLILQDGPFISFRLVLVFYYNVVSYMTAFVIAKNAMVITLQVNVFIAIEKKYFLCNLSLIVDVVILHLLILVLSCICVATAKSCGVEK